MQIKVGTKIVDLPDDYDPRNSTEEYMCDKDLAYFKNVLQKQLDDISKKLKAEDIDNDNADKRSADEADLSSIEAETLAELRTKDRLRKLSKEIEEFIEKIDRNLYGFCEECGDDIGRKRLYYNPLSRFCIADQTKHDQNEDQKERDAWTQSGTSNNYETETDSYENEN